MKVSLAILALLEGTSALKMHREPLIANAGHHVTADPFAVGPTHPMDYFVPNFGKDGEILASESSTAGVEKSMGHTWTPYKDEETEEWVLPQPIPESDYIYGHYMIDKPGDNFVQLESTVEPTIA